MTENFPNLAKEIDISVQEVQRVPNKMSPKWPTPRHIIIKMPKAKDKEVIFLKNLFICSFRGGSMEKESKRNINV